MVDKLESYVCSLRKNGITQTKQDVKENRRMEALETFRDWVVQQKDWLATPTDASFLLRFLRNKRFGQLKTREKFVLYWTCKTRNPKWLTKLDTNDEKMERIFKQGLFIPVPGHDSKGRKVCLVRWGLLDTSGKSYSPDDVMKACALMNEFILMEEQTQIGGVVILEDFSGFGVKHSKFLGLDLSTRIASVFTRAYPIRFKGIHDYNGNPVFEALLNVVKPFMKRKLIGRIYLHGKSMTPIYEHIKMSSLPVEYLPDEYSGPNAGTLQELIDGNLKVLHSREVHDYLLYISSPRFGVDEKRRPPDSELLTASFIN